jgi:hypothetical protein
MIELPFELWVLVFENDTTNVSIDSVCKQWYEGMSYCRRSFLHCQFYCTLDNFLSFCNMHIFLQDLTNRNKQTTFLYLPIKNLKKDCSYTVKVSLKDLLNQFLELFDKNGTLKIKQIHHPITVIFDRYRKTFCIEAKYSDVKKLPIHISEYISKDG